MGNNLVIDDLRGGPTSLEREARKKEGRRWICMGSHCFLLFPLGTKALKTWIPGMGLRMASSLLKCICCRDSWNLNCKLRSFLARDFNKGGQGLPWEPWLEGYCLDTEALSQDCSEFAFYECCFQQPSINCHLPSPSPLSRPYNYTGLLIFRSSCQDNFFSPIDYQQKACLIGEDYPRKPRRYA